LALTVGIATDIAAVAALVMNERRDDDDDDNVDGVSPLMDILVQADTLPSDRIKMDIDNFMVLSGRKYTTSV